MRKQETKQYAVEGGEVEITLMALGGMEGSKLGVMLGGLIGPSVIALFVASDAQSAAAGAEAGRMLAEKLTAPVYEVIVKQLLKGAQMKTKDGDFEDVTMTLLDDTFSGNVASIYKLVFDALRLNFRNFSQGLGISSTTLAKLTAIAEKQMEKAGAPGPSSPRA